MGGLSWSVVLYCFFFFQAEDGIRDYDVTGVQTCALPILLVVVYEKPRIAGLFYVQDVLYAAGAWMHKSDLFVPFLSFVQRKVLYMDVLMLRSHGCERAAPHR